MGSDYTHVFSPITVRGVEFKNRIVHAPASANQSSLDGRVTTQFIDWYRMFARGGVSTIYVGNASIDRTECKDEPFQLDLGTDDAIRDLARYAEMGKQYGCHASLEINHNGENTPFEMVGHAPYSSSPRLSDNEILRAQMLGRDPIPAIEMTKEKIAETVEKYGAAAGRMARAGMDICLVHGGHGNLISQFTSPLYNKRTDEYGGSTENRARFAIEVCDSIRKHCGENFVIEFRLSADEIADEGMHFDETLELIGYLKDHLDIVHVSAGLHSDFNFAYYRNWCQGYMMDHCFNVHYARDIKKAYPDLLVTTVGSIMSLDEAEEILANGWADFVAMCRPLMADPDMPAKYAHNQPQERRPCLRCETCAKHVMVPKPIYCAVNPMSAMATELKDGVVPRAPRRKKVAVIGGGPGGITAFTTLCERGHDVTLYEKSDQLGGNVITAALPPFKGDCRDYLTWLRYQAEKYAADGGAYGTCATSQPAIANTGYTARILMNTTASKELLDQEGYDALVIAVGALPHVPEVPGVDKDHVMWVPDAERNQDKVGQKVVVIGSGTVGLEAAIEFDEQGKDVTVVQRSSEQVTMDKLFAVCAGGANEFKREIGLRGIPVHYNMPLVQITDDEVVCQDAETGEERRFPADTVLLATGMVPCRDVVDELRHCAPETDVYVIGDCKKPATIAEAVNGAFQAALHI